MRSSRLSPMKVGSGSVSTKWRLIWNGISPRAVKLGGRQIGMSLVVRIVGQVTLVPAEAPR